MKTTSHGKDPLFMVKSEMFTNARGRPLVAFGWSEAHAKRKIAEHLHATTPVGKPRAKLRLIQGGKTGGAA